MSSLQLALDVLDDGARIYRRHALALLRISVGVGVPLLCALLLLRAADRSTARLLILPLGYLALLHTLTALARTIAGLLDDRPIALRRAFGSLPSGNHVLFCVMFSMAPTLIAWSMVLLLDRLIDATFDSVLLPLFNRTPPIPGALIAAYRLAQEQPLRLILPGVWCAGNALAVQPFQERDATYSQASQRMNHLINRRFWATIIVLLSAGTIVSLLAAALLGPIDWLLSARAANRRGRAIDDGWIMLAGAVVAAMLLAPLLATWTGVLYRRLHAEHRGGDLDSRIARWRSSLPPTTS